MRQPRKPQPQMVSEPNLQPDEAALLERFRRLRDGQKRFLSRTLDLLLSSATAPPKLRAEHVMMAAWWRLPGRGERPEKRLDRCKAIWENPTGLRFDIADPLTQHIFPPEDYEEN